MLSGGGTGGHVYPLLAVVEHLRTQEARQHHEFLYLGRADSIEQQLCEREDLPFQAIAAGALKEASFGARLRSLAQLAAGTVGSLRALASFKPDVALVSGAYVSAPPAVAAWLRRCPVAIYLPDMEPGMAVRGLRRVARRVAVSFPETAAHFAPGQAVVTGYPVRRALFETPRADALRRLELSPDLPTLLVMGGSQGARAINQAIAKQLRRLLGRAQIVHLSGHWDISWLREERAKLRPDLQARYHIHAYLHQIADAMVSADLVVARAGAATLAEFPAAGLPAILVPYPHAGQHQDRNAGYLVSQGAALKLDESELEGRVADLVLELLGDPARLQGMRQQAQRLAHPDAAAQIAALLRELAEGTQHKSG